MTDGAAPMLDGALDRVRGVRRGTRDVAEDRPSSASATGAA